MAEPETRFRVIPNNTATSAVDTAAKRTGNISGQQVVSTGSGNEADFGTVDISEGANNSNVLTMLWDVTEDGGNSTVEDFKLWLSLNDFDQAQTGLKFRALSGADNSSPTLTQSYVQGATVSSYSWGDLPESEPDNSNLFPSDEGTSMSLDSGSDDAVMWAWYLSVAAGETTGTYAGTTEDYSFRASLRYSYS